MLAAAFAAAGLIALTGSAMAKVSIKHTLNGTVHAPGATGQARLFLKTGSSGKFTVKGRHLPAGKTFDVVVNKIKIGTLTTNAGGSGTAKFSTTPKGRIAMLGTDPQGSEVEVRDDQGDDVLDGEMPDDDADSAIGCCLGSQEDDGEGECEDLTAADCMAKGGTPTTATDCLPDPCGNNPPPTGSVCCSATNSSGAAEDDDPEVECEDDTSATECATQGGMMVQGTCDANPCQPAPPPNLVICCVSQGDQGEQEGEPETEPAECEHITADECMAANGMVSTATSCDPDPCGGSGS
jgi:hypothetical protein